MGGGAFDNIGKDIFGERGDESTENQLVLGLPEKKVGIGLGWLGSVVVRGRNWRWRFGLPSMKPKRCCPFRYGTIWAFHNK
jgi:hypothetical protein